MVKEPITETIDYLEGILDNWGAWQSHHIKLSRALRDTINLVKELTTENERYKRYYLNHEYDKMEADIKACTVKEMQLRLAEKMIDNIEGRKFRLLYEDELEQIVCEMLEGKQWNLTENRL